MRPQTTYNTGRHAQSLFLSSITCWTSIGGKPLHPDFLIGDLAKAWARNECCIVRLCTDAFLEWKMICNDQRCSLQFVSQLTSDCVCYAIPISDMELALLIGRTRSWLTTRIGVYPCLSQSLESRTEKIWVPDNWVNFRWPSQRLAPASSNCRYPKF